MDIIDEVAEEVQHEKFLNLWRRFSIFVYVFLGCVIIGTALYAFWKDHEEKEIKKASTLYAQALKLEESRNVKEAQKTFQRVIDSGLSGFKSLSELSLSNLLGSLPQKTEQETKEARKFLEDLASSSKSPKSLRKLGAMKLLLSDVEAKDMPFLKERLDALLKDTQIASSFLFQEVRASFEYHAGNLEKSYGLYEALLKNQKAPHGVRHRALRMVMLLKSKGVLKSIQKEELI